MLSLKIKRILPQSFKDISFLGVLMDELRRPGQVVKRGENRIWLVIDESTKTPDGWVHECGTSLLSCHLNIQHVSGRLDLAADGHHEEEIPYCPKCESRPTFGELNSSGLYIK